VLPEDGEIVASPDVPPHVWSSAFPDEVGLLVLAPGSERGWFGGRAVVTWAPESVTAGDAGHAADETERSFSDAAVPSLTVALLPYSGTATVARHMGGIVWTAQGWRVWGTASAGDARALGTMGPPQARNTAPLAVDPISDQSEAEFLAGVRSVIEAIKAGDVYVVNLTRRITGRPAASPAAAFASLAGRTCADMAAYWRTPGAVIASASPERFLRLNGTRLDVSPIKGTRPRRDGAADATMRAELAASEKERAEHVMIVDLERNDLGRVCVAGSVVVDPLFEVVTTTYCHQMVSTVAGILRDDASLRTLLHAAFPCGSITGAPKIAAMRTIAALEASPRRAYTGSLVVATPGEIDSSVLIRTAEYVDEVVLWGTGGGITVDSDPAEEWLETVLKASPFFGDGRWPAA
jgi:anthranilate/para-aminobenzoate synthase component I